LEAPHRGYEDAAALFGSVRSDDTVASAVAQGLGRLLAEVRPSAVLAPLGIGGHVDHLIVRDAVVRLSGRRLRLWEDWPYLACASYVTQLAFQFGDAGALAERLEAQQAEWLHPHPPDRSASSRFPAPP
jgi:LmbE family N-acetylglucosaminyl deacetylase